MTRAPITAKSGTKRAIPKATLRSIVSTVCSPSRLRGFSEFHRPQIPGTAFPLTPINNFTRSDSPFASDEPIGSHTLVVGEETLEEADQRRLIFLRPVLEDAPQTFGASMVDTACDVSA